MSLIALTAQISWSFSNIESGEKRKRSGECRHFVICLPHIQRHISIPTNKLSFLNEHSYIVSMLVYVYEGHVGSMPLQDVGTVARAIYPIWRKSFNIIDIY